DTLTRSGYGESTCVGLGGDPVLGSTFDEILWKFEQDKKTKAVVMTGEIGGVYEERATDTIGKMKTPVLAMVGGIFAPPGKRMGHAGAIVEGKMGTAKEKLDMLAEAGAHACKTFLDIPETLKKLGV
ncbi:MAG: succinate--CoA ligase subunit alpha, partial [Candidatus Zixiibacteriota bacterium]